jgi:hypothetical protein
MTSPIKKSIVPDYAPQSRFLIIEGPLQLLPHKCATCSRGYATDTGGRTSDLKFFNCNLDLEFFGNLYICVDCVREMAMQLGMVQAKDVQALEKAHEEEVDKGFKLEEENEELRHDVASFRALINSSVSASGGAGILSEKTPGPEVGAGEPKPAGTTKQSEDSGKSHDKPDAGKANAIEQTPEQGSPDIFTDLSFDDLSSDV